MCDGSCSPSPPGSRAVDSAPFDEMSISSCSSVTRDVSPSPSDGSSESAVTCSMQCTSAPGVTPWNVWVNPCAQGPAQSGVKGCGGPAAASPPIAFEVCCGSAELTRALSRVGFAAQGIDCSANPFTPVAPCRWIDVATGAGADYLWQLLRDSPTAYVHFSPPNRTLSKGRMADRKRKQIRSLDFPAGIPGVVEEAVSEENSIALHISSVITSFRQLCTPPAWSLESPSTSLFWELPPIRELFDLRSQGQLAFSSCEVALCMHGSRALSTVRILASTHFDLSPLVKPCDGSDACSCWALRP